MGTYTNITPPIRRLDSDLVTRQGSPVRSHYTDQDDSSDDDTASIFLSTSSMTSLESVPDLEELKTASSANDSGHTSSLESLPTSQLPKIEPLVDGQRLLRAGVITNKGCGPTSLSPISYTSGAVQTEIDMGISQSPSLDAQTQQHLTAKYRALARRVQSEGFYECPYIEYGKETVRYFTLFTCFLACLRSEWYLTSACFLGLFWVRQTDSFQTCTPWANSFPSIK